MSQAELARSVGASRSWVVQIERGNPGAEVGLVLKALRALHLTMDVGIGKEAVSDEQAGAGALHHIDLARILDRALNRDPSD
jgi:HTH-type transcriptional regulator/antitoxin HipB